MGDDANCTSHTTFHMKSRVLYVKCLSVCVSVAAGETHDPIESGNKKNERNGCVHLDTSSRFVISYFG